MPILNGAETIALILEHANIVPENQPFVLLHRSLNEHDICEGCKNLKGVINLYKPLNPKEILRSLRNIQKNPIAGKDPEDSSPAQKNQPGNGFAPVILVAEDNFMNMILVTTLLKKIIPEVNVLKAPNGRVELEIAISETPDLIIMDIQMPEMTGIEATVEIRNYEKAHGGHIPIVALTAGFEKGKCMEAGMDGFMSKPLNANMLESLLSDHLEGFSRLHQPLK